MTPFLFSDWFGSLGAPNQIRKKETLGWGGVLPWHRNQSSPFPLFPPVQNNSARRLNTSGSGVPTRGSAYPNC